MEHIDSLVRRLSSFDITLFTTGKSQVTLLDVAIVILCAALIFVVSGWLRNWVSNRLLAASPLHVGTRQIVASLVRYLFLVLALLSLIQSIGIDLSAFSFLAGALGVGLGFGLQNIVSNFISGLIVMLERPIHIGDLIEVQGIEGRVVDIGARRTALATREGVIAIIPNSKFITENVKNHNSPDFGERGLRLTIGVATDNDLRGVQALLVNTVAQQAQVVKHPAPEARLLNLTGGVTHFELRMSTTVSGDKLDALASELRLEIDAALRKHGIKRA